MILTYEIYPLLNGTAMGDDLMYLFIYADTITHSLSTIFICLAFFLVTL